jgi:hypothetical protein
MEFVVGKHFMIPNVDIFSDTCLHKYHISFLNESTQSTSSVTKSNILDIRNVCCLSIELSHAF